MNNQEEINSCLAQAIQQRTTTEIIATMGTKILTLQNFQQLIRKYNRNILSKTIEEYYLKIIQENNSIYGITLEIFQKLIETMPQPKQRSDIVINIVERIQQKKVSLERIFGFFDKNNSGFLKGDELKEMFEYIHPKITEQEIKTLLKNNQQVQFSLEDLKTLLSYEQNSNAEIVIVKGLNDCEESDSVIESYETDEDRIGEDFLDEYRYPETSPQYTEYQKFRKFYNEAKESKQKFVDEKFPPNDNSLGLLCDSYEWKRLTDVWNKADIFKADLYHNKSEPGLYSLVSPRDIKQGTLGDCYFLSSLASIAKKHPQLIADLFLTQKINQYGVYAVWLCLFGQWQIIILDDYVPFDKDDPAFCGSDCYEMWVILLEKAWAKVYGSYSNIISGDPREVIASITGGPTWCIQTDDKNFSARLAPLVDSNYIVCAGTYSENSDYETVGLIPNHAYSVLNFRTIKLPNKKEVQLIKLKNPYGNEMEWNGDWSDHSPLWTQELKDNVLKHQDKDGIFYMSLPDFKKYFDCVFVGFCSPYYKQNQIIVNCQRGKASYILITIKKDIEIYFSAYQKSKRMFKQSNQYQEYEYSNIRMILCKMQKNNTISYVTSAQQADMSFHIGGRLQKGQYLLQIKADWIMEGWDSSDVALVGYGEDDPEMKFCQKIPRFQQALILQEVNDERENLLQKNQKLKTNPVSASDPNLVYLKDKSKAFQGISYLYYQNLSKDKIYSFNLKIGGQVKIKKPLTDSQIEVELKPGQEKIVCYKYIGKGTTTIKIVLEDLVVNDQT